MLTTDQPIVTVREACTDEDHLRNNLMQASGGVVRVQRSAYNEWGETNPAWGFKPAACDTMK